MLFKEICVNLIFTHISLIYKKITLPMNKGAAVNGREKNLIRLYDSRLAIFRYSIGKMPVLFLNSSAKRLEVV